MFWLQGQLVAVTSAAEMTSAVKKKYISFIFVFDSSPIFLGKKNNKKKIITFCVQEHTKIPILIL